jgi:hypothetical protein
MKEPLEIVFVVGIVALVIFPIALITIGGIRAKREDEQDIMGHGRATIGTVTRVEEVPASRAGTIWKVTVEFTVPDKTDPVRVELMAPTVAWTKRIQRIQDLCPGQKVSLHYREKWPSLAILDELVD